MTTPDAPRVVAFVDDLMDRSRLRGIDGLTFTRDASACTDADVVIVDLARHAAVIPEVVAAAPHARIVAFGSHVDTDALDDAARDGAALVLPRSRFLGDPAAVVRTLLDG